MIVRILVGAVGGGMLGFGWCQRAGCSTGACPLTSNPWIYIAYGMAVVRSLPAVFAKTIKLTNLL
jgi:hypothetical protein